METDGLSLKATEGEKSAHLLESTLKAGLRGLNLSCIP